MTVEKTIPSNYSDQSQQGKEREFEFPAITYRVIYRAVFKWLSQVITRLRLLRLVIGSKDTRQFFKQWEAKPKPIASFPALRASYRWLPGIVIGSSRCLFLLWSIGRSNCFGFGFSPVVWKALNLRYDCFWFCLEKLKWKFWANY